MGIFTTIINQNFADIGKFWGEYKYLNSVDNGYSNEAIHNYQLSKLNTLLSGSKANNYNSTNSFIQQSEFNLTQLDMFYNNIDNKLYEKIVNIFNAPLKKSTAYKTKGKIDGKRILQDINQVRIELARNGLVSLKTLDRVEAWVNNNFSGIQNMKEYTQFKSNEIESLVASVIQNSDTFLAYNSISTGQLRNKKGQIIQDVMTFSQGSLNKNLNSLGGEYSATLKGNEVSINTIQELLNLLNSIPSNESYQITISDDLYDAISSASSLSSQVKSGINQPIINRNESGNITLGQLNSSVFQGLQEIQNIGNYFKSSFSSPELTSIANYEMAHIIGEILHINELQNHIFFTEKGFESPYNWMRRHKATVKLQKEITGIGMNFLTLSRAYRLRLNTF